MGINSSAVGAPGIEGDQLYQNCVARESHFGENVLVTRKGAVRAREGDMGIIPDSAGRAFLYRSQARVTRRVFAVAATAPEERCRATRLNAVSP
jgi:hypothetical protein